MMSHPHLTTEQIKDWEATKGNFTITPNYVDLVIDIWGVLSWYYKPSMWHNYKFPRSFIDEFTRNFYFPIYQAYYIIYLAIFITILRYLFEKYFCRVSKNVFPYFARFFFNI